MTRAEVPSIVEGEAAVELEGSNRTEGFEVAFLPWLGVEQSITVGPVTFSPFELGSVPEPAARDYLSRYFRRYVEVDGKPLRVIVLARHASVTDFRYHTELERPDLRRAVAALALSGITEAWVVRIVHHNEVPVPSADAFQLIFQRFTANSNFVGVTAGRTLHTWPLDKVMFTRPWAASPVFGGTDRHLLEALGTILLRPCGFAPDFVERVWRSVEWFRLAHLDGADQTDEAKLVATATAFESLFGLPMSGKQEAFAKNMEGLVRDREMERDVRIRRNGKTINLSFAGCWAGTFTSSEVAWYTAMQSRRLPSTPPTGHLISWWQTLCCGSASSESFSSEAALVLISEMPRKSSTVHLLESRRAPSPSMHWSGYLIYT